MFFQLNCLTVAFYKTYKTYSKDKSVTTPIPLAYKKSGPSPRGIPKGHKPIVGVQGLMNSESTQLQNHQRQAWAELFLKS